MDIRYNVVDMLRTEDGIVKSIDIEMYLYGGGPHLNKKLKIELGPPSGAPIPFSNITQNTIQNWLMLNEDGMDRMVLTSQQIERESTMLSGLPWGG